MSFIKFHSYLCNGFEKDPLTIEALKTRGLSQLLLTGLPDAWLKDSRDKIRALTSKISEWGSLDRVLLHLLPPERSKFGAHLELPMALAILAVLEGDKLSDSVRCKAESFRFVGALNLQGEIQSTDWLDSVMMSDDSDARPMIGPRHFKNLLECWEFLQSESALARIAQPPRVLSEPEAEHPVDGLEWEKFWLMGAALWQLPTLLIGPPGAGKSTLARWAQGLALWPSERHAQDCRRIHRIAGLQPPDYPPRLRPHARAHLSEFIGFGAEGTQRPGYFSLSHGGTLVLDEFLELNRDCREILRNVIDERRVVRNSKNGLRTWPAEFWLLATTNPCGCGKRLENDLSQCLCTRGQIEMYRQKLTGPIADRFGLKMWLQLEDRKQAGTAPLIAKLSVTDFQALQIEARRVAEGRLERCRERIDLLRPRYGLSPRQCDLQAKLLSGLEAITEVADIKPRIQWPELLSLKLIGEKKHALDSMPGL